MKMFYKDNTNHSIQPELKTLVLDIPNPDC